MIQPVNDDEWLIDARTNLSEINDLLKADLPLDESDTLGGFIYSELGKVPLPGDEVRHEHLQLKVMNVAGRRIGKVRVRRQSEEAVNEAQSHA